MNLYYLVPVLPLVPRVVLAVANRRRLLRNLTPAEGGREVIRPSVLSLAGLSFAALVAVVVLDEARTATFQLSAYYLAISFLAYFAALGLQSYKFTVALDILGELLIDIGSLGLVSAVAALVFAGSYATSVQWTVALASMAIFTGDFVTRLVLIHIAYRKLQP